MNTKSMKLNKRFLSALLFFLVLSLSTSGFAQEIQPFSPGHHGHDDDDRSPPAPLTPRAQPYALAANNGIVKVRFSVRLTGQAKQVKTVTLRQTGSSIGIGMNDQGVDGDIHARDGIYGVTVPIDTSALQPDSCLNYEAVLSTGAIETVSSQLPLRVSSLPVSVADSDTSNPVTFENGSKAVADEILVTAKPDTSIDEIRLLAASIHATIVGSIPPLNLYQLKRTTPASAAQLLALVEQLNARSEVKAAFINAIGQAASSAPNDPEYTSQHGLQLVRAQDVWASGATGNGVTIVVLDTGLDSSHPDLNAAWTCQDVPLAIPPLPVPVVLTPCTATAIGSTPAEHGTEVAGIIAASTSNNTGVAGVAFGSSIHAIKMRNFTTAGMIAGFQTAAGYVAANGNAKIVNASFNVVDVFTNMDTLCAAIESVVSAGAIVINAAGNQNINGASYPARCNDLNANLISKQRFITVSNSTSIVHANCGSAAVDQRCAPGTPANPAYLGSNYGAWVDISAPGSEIRTTSTGGTYASVTGTSFSAPFVSGAAAILATCGVPLDQIESSLKMMTNPVGKVNVGFPDGSSAPRLDIYLALKELNHTPSSVSLSNNSLNENLNTTSGVVVGTLTTADLDTCDKHTYTIVGGADAAVFSIGGATADSLMLSDGVLRAAKPSYAVTVRTTDYFGKTFDQNLTVNVVAAPPVNHAPTIANQSFTINENSATGTTVGSVLASDQDIGNTLSYAITSGNTGNALNLNSSTGALSVNSASITSSFALTVRVTDNLSAATSATVTVNVNNAPAISSQSFSINEGSSNGTSVGSVVASDPNGNSISYNITAGNTGNAFSIDPSTGGLSVYNSAALVYATTPTFTLTVRVVDGGGLTASATVTVNLNAVAITPPPAGGGDNTGGGSSSGSGSGAKGGGGGCSIKAVGSKPDSSLPLTMLAVLAYWLYRNRGRHMRPNPGLAGAAPVAVCG